MSELTFGAVVPLPSGQANNAARGGAGVVSELIISWPAEICASRSIIVSITGHPKIVLDGRIDGLMLVLCPIGRHIQDSLNRQSRY